MEVVRVNVPGIHSRELVEVISTPPYCRTADGVEANIAKRQTTSDYLKPKGLWEIAIPTN